MNINKLIIAGRLGKDPEMRTTPNGKNVTQFTVATNRTWKDGNGQKQEFTEWVNCVAWGKTAESINTYFKKGKEIYCEGRLQTRSWEDQEGKKHYRTEMIVDNFQFVGYDKDSTGGGQSSYPAPSDDYSQPDAQDELPTIQAGGEDISVEDIPF